jgi:hypothetical protein
MPADPRASALEPDVPGGAAAERPAPSPAAPAARGTFRELPAGWIRGAYLAVALLVVAIAWGPLLRAGFLGSDMEILLKASGRLPATQEALEQLSKPDAPPLPPDAQSLLGRNRTLSRLPAIEVLSVVGDDRTGDVGSLLSGYSLILSQRLFGSASPGPLGLSPALFYRIENLLWLALACLGAERFLRRVVRPWIGAAQAARASATAAFLLFLHPLCLPSVASLSGRSDLLALCFGAFSAAAFLRGRQEHSQLHIGISYGLALLASLSGQVALMLPFAVALGELASAHRYRPLRRRLRTAATSLLVFGLLVQLNALVVSLSTQHGYYPQVGYSVLRLFEPGGFQRALLYGAEKFGALLLPANWATLGALGLLLAAGLLALVLGPALSAARSAPRLWGWISLWWLAAVSLGLLFSLHERISLDGLAQARQLLPAVAATCAGLGLYSTAMQGPQRLAVPLGLALGYAVLAHGNALPWRVGAEQLERFRADLLYAHRAIGPRTPLLVLDAPHQVLGLDPLGSAARNLLHPLFAPRRADPSSTAVALPVFDLSSQGYTVLAAQPDFDALVPPDTILGVPPGDAAGALGPPRGHLFLRRREAAGFAPPDLPRLAAELEPAGTRFDLGLSIAALPPAQRPRLEFRVIDLGSLASRGFLARPLAPGHYQVDQVGLFLLGLAGGRAAVLGAPGPEVDPQPRLELRWALFYFDGDLPLAQAAGELPIEALGP